MSSQSSSRSRRSPLPHLGIYREETMSNKQQIPTFFIERCPPESGTPGWYAYEDGTGEIIVAGLPTRDAAANAVVRYAQHHNLPRYAYYV